MKITHDEFEADLTYSRLLNINPNFSFADMMDEYICHEIDLTTTLHIDDKDFAIHYQTSEGKLSFNDKNNLPSQELEILDCDEFESFDDAKQEQINDYITSTLYPAALHAYRKEVENSQEQISDFLEDQRARAEELASVA